MGCMRLRGAMCRCYHIGAKTPAEAQDELAMRLAFEVVFGIVSEAAVASGKWLDRRLRDRGHCQYMAHLWFLASCAPMRYRWIPTPIL